MHRNPGLELACIPDFDSILPLEGRQSIDRMWESFSPAAQERILRLLAGAIARVLSKTEEEL